jgi:hypothetical protein
LGGIHRRWMELSSMPVAQPPSACASLRQMPPEVQLLFRRIGMGHPAPRRKQIRAASIRANDPNIYTMSAHSIHKRKLTDLLFNHYPPCVSPRTIQLQYYITLILMQAKILGFFKSF